MNRQERKEIGKEVEQINRRFERRYYKPVLSSLNWKVDQLITVIRADGINGGVFYLTTDLGNERLSRTIQDLYRTVGLRHASRTWSGLRKQQREAVKSLLTGFKTKGVSQWVQFIIDYLNRFLLEKITYQVASNTRDRLLKVLQDGAREGKGVDEMVRELKELPFLRWKAAQIVRTEIKRAGETGAKAASRDFGYEQEKVWITIKDRRTRGNPINGQDDHANHWNMDGQTVEEDEKFFDSRSGVYLEFPGDPEAEAKDTINCRCTHAYVAKRDERGRLIPKRSRISVLQPGRINRQIITI